ncbi:MAG: carboxypeptidase-like regulatory domain-containing protein [Bryobacteraceae bacterium]
MDRVKRIALGALFLTLTSTLLAQEPPERAGLEGRVINEAGAPVSGALITYTRSFGQGAPGAAVASARANETGTFNIRDLAAGSYAICVQTPGQLYLDPCIWDDPEAKVTLAANQTRRDMRLTVRTGARLRVRITDENRLLAGSAREGAEGHVEAGIWMPNGLYLRLPIVARDSGQSHEIVVPTGTSLHLSLTMTGVALYEKDGDGLPPGRAAIAVNIPKGEASKTFEFTTAPPVR